jgi:hypothetical protein
MCLTIVLFDCNAILHLEICCRLETFPDKRNISKKLLLKPICYKIMHHNCLLLSTPLLHRQLRHAVTVGSCSGSCTGSCAGNCTGSWAGSCTGSWTGSCAGSWVRQLRRQLIVVTKVFNVFSNYLTRATSRLWETPSNDIKASDDLWQHKLTPYAKTAEWLRRRIHCLYMHEDYK